MENIIVVPMFSEVIHEEVQGLLSEREIEFVIELTPRTKPIPKAPYRMVLPELKELKVQMQELLDRGFICSSSSL